ncbi:MAG: T9SS type A sorting domain-containing protein [Bacteroidota bacterium]
MKKHLSVLILVMAMFGISKPSFAQGLEGIVVEKYYISNANDASVNSTGGVLPVGSVTYRVFADLAPGYQFQAVYGDANHELRLETTTLFFNNEDRGAPFPTFSKNFCDDNTVMLDSWISVGAACASNYGVLKVNDDGVATVVNNDGVLLNNDPLMGIPLTQQDGFIAGTPQPVTAVNVTALETMLDAQNDGTNGPLFSTNNGSWASLSGSSGVDPLLNHVLLAQITTDGTFSFKLNLQIRNASTFQVENYVAQNPIGNEILEPTLTYSSTGSSITNIVNQPRLNIYPNPANETLWLELRNADASEYLISDLTGNIIYAGEIMSGNNAVDVSGLAQGSYFIRLSNSTTVSKFIKL